jgi:hypothetical protein
VWIIVVVCLLLCCCCCCGGGYYYYTSRKSLARDESLGVTSPPRLAYNYGGEGDTWDTPAPGTASGGVSSNELTAADVHALL